MRREKYEGYKPFPDEPDFKEFDIEGEGLVRIRRNKNKRIDNKWEKRYGYTKKKVKYHGLIIRNPQFGNLNGYVGVPVETYFFGKEYAHDEQLESFRVHGGVTYSGMGWDNSLFRKNLWYIGFDTAHHNDLLPSMVEMREKFGLETLTHGVYKDISYVENEIYRLVKQIENPDLSNEMEFDLKDLGLGGLMKMVFGV